MDMSVLWKLTYGMYALTAMDGARPTGCIINTAIQVTSANPTVAISLNRNNYTYDVIKKAGRFALSIISEETPQMVIACLGFCSGRDRDKFAGDDFAWEMREGLPVVTDGTSGYLICEVVGSMEMETHFVIVARILSAEALSAKTPMTYKYYHEVVKGKAPKNAPTYQEEKPAASVGARWVCGVCGYIYEGDLEQEPDDYKCPVCKQPKSVFKKQ